MSKFFVVDRNFAIPCPHQPPTRGDNTVSVAQGSAATPGATKQLLPPDRVLRELTAHQPIWGFGMMVRVFANSPGDLGSIQGRVIPKT